MTAKEFNQALRAARCLEIKWSPIFKIARNSDTPPQIFSILARPLAIPEFNDPRWLPG